METGFGIIGGGLMGREFASAIARWNHLIGHPATPKLVGVASRSAKSLEYFKSYSCQLTTDYRELLRNPQVRAVYAAVPHDLHERVYCDVLNAGKHLLGEKPFGIDLATNQRILQCIQQHPNLTVSCCSEFPYFPGARRVLTMAQRGEFGRILDVECGLLHSSDMDPKKPINWKRRIATNGEYGCMGDLGMHVLHLPLRAGWRIRDVRSILSKIVTHRPASAGSSELVPCETWDNATLLCNAECDGAEFPLTAKMMRIAPGETNTWYISVKGTKASARFSTRNPRSFQFLVYEPGQPQCWQEESLGYETPYKTITGGIFEFGFGDAMLQMIASFCHALVADAEPPMPCATPQEAATTHRVFTAALKSWATQQVIEV